MNYRTKSGVEKDDITGWVIIASLRRSQLLSRLRFTTRSLARRFATENGQTDVLLALLIFPGLC